MKLVVHLIAGVALSGAAQAQSFPQKPIHIVAPASAGSGTDLMARMVGQAFSTDFGQPVIVENRVGGGGMVGVGAVAAAPADGYMLLLSTDATIAIQPNLRPQGPQPESLAPVGQISSFPMVVVTTPASGVDSIAGLAEWARKARGGLSYGMGGVGTGGHIIGETIKRSLNLPVTAVAYPSAQRAVTDLLGGHVDFAVSDVLSVVPHIASGQLKALAIAGSGRAGCLRDVPTLAEQGVAFELPYAYGLMAPAGTPPEVVEQLNRSLNKALQSTTVQQRLVADCQTPTLSANSPAEFGHRVAEHHAGWGRLIRDTGISLEQE